MADVDDDMLMARVQARDEAAFGCLVDRHLDSLHRYLARLTQSAADADELAQEAFLRLWQQAGSYRPGTVRLTTWLHRIAHNAAVDRLRRRRGETRAGAWEGPATTAASPPPGSGIAAEPALDGPDPEALAVAAETGRLLERAITALPATQRAALLLCQVQGFSTRETAEILGQSARAVESLIARARRSLRAALMEERT